MTPVHGMAILPFSRTQSEALRALRRRYEHDHDLFTAQELMRLRFMRWLYLMRRLAP